MESTGPDIAQQGAGEAFIPFLFEDLIEMCLRDGGLPDDQHQSFAEFCSFYAATTNFLSHHNMQNLDRDYSGFNPDSEMRQAPFARPDQEEAAKRVVEAFGEIAISANYRRLSRDEILASFTEQSLIKLRTHVDLDEFSELLVYVRGDDSRVVEGKGFLGRKKEQQVEIWRRVLMLLRFKQDSELTPAQLKRKTKGKLPYKPGKIYLYQYKEVPKPDLEILFPNVKVSMNIKDRALLGVPAVAAAVGTFLKVGAQIAIVAGVIVYVFFKKAMFEFDPDESVNLMPATIAFLSIIMAFGALFFNQYTTYKNKRIRFLKDVSEHLFFRNLAMNKSVLDHVIDEGEDEDGKEAILVYYHLLACQDRKFNRTELDEQIQDWMLEKYQTHLDFDINDPVETLQSIRGMTNLGEWKTLLTEEEDGTLSIPSLAEAKEIMDYHWDHAFEYSRKADKEHPVVAAGV